jgi:hypothetical protein
MERPDTPGHDHKLETDGHEVKIFHEITTPILGTRAMIFFHTMDPCECESIKCNVDDRAQEQSLHLHILEIFFQDQLSVMRIFINFH